MTHRLRRLLRVLLAVATVATLGALDARPVAAAVPGNDAFAAATVLTGELPITVDGTNVDATKEAGEPDHAGNPGGASVWYSWTPAADSSVTVDLCATAGFDTLLAVYTGGALDALTEVASNDDRCEARSRVDVAVTAGEPLAIAVDGWGGQQGPFTLSISAVVPPPANDAFADAVELTGPLPLSVLGNNELATAEPGEPDRFWIGEANRSLWYRWTADATGQVTIETCDELEYFQSVVAVYTGDDLTDLTLRDADVQQCGYAARVVIDAVAGTTYRIAVDSWGPLGDAGDFRLTLRWAGPPNDNLASATPLDGPLPIVTTGTSTDGTREVWEPHQVSGEVGDAIGYQTVWWAWTPTSDGRVTVETCGSNVDTSLHVWAGTSWADLAFVGRNSDACGRQSRVTFDAVAGQPYRIGVVGLGANPDQLVLTIADAGAAPANDDLVAAQPLSGLPVAAYGTNTDATEEPGEPDHVGPTGGVSVWYAWTADHDGDVIAETCGSALDTLLAVYAGDALDALTPLGGNDDLCNTQSQVRFTAVTGTTYRIVVDGWSGAQGGFRLSLRAAQPPSNDAFAAAVPLVGPVPLRAAGTTLDATLEPGEPGDYSASGHGASAWYRWTPVESEEVVVDTCGSASVTVLGIWTGAAVDAIEPAPGQTVGRCGDDASIRFPAAAGTTYWISVDGAYRALDRDGDLALGDFRLLVRRPGAPANDDLADATALAGRLPITVRASNVDATLEAGEPAPAILGPDRTADTSIWFRWTAPSADPVVVENCGSGTALTMGVFTGDTVDTLQELDFHGYRSGVQFGCGIDQGRIHFTPVAGTTYRIVVAGVAEDQGDVRLTLRRNVAPANDAFAAASPVRGQLPAAADGDTADATREPGEPAIGEANGTVWYRWTAPASGPVVADTCGSVSDQTAVGVFTGTALGQLQAAAIDEDRCGGRAAARFDAIAGTTYRIAVATEFDTSGAVHLVLRRPAPPANDRFADATVLRAPTTIHATTVDATVEAGEPANGATTGASIWYRWTATTSGLVAIDTCATTEETALAVYTGASLGSLQPVARSGDQACLGQSLVVFRATQGTTYSIAVDGAEPFGAEGPVELRFTCDGRACR